MRTIAVVFLLLAAASAACAQVEVLAVNSEDLDVECFVVPQNGIIRVGEQATQRHVRAFIYFSCAEVPDDFSSAILHLGGQINSRADLILIERPTPSITERRQWDYWPDEDGAMVGSFYWSEPEYKAIDITEALHSMLPLELDYMVVHLSAPICEGHFGAFYGHDHDTSGWRPKIVFEDPVAADTRSFGSIKDSFR